MLAARKGFLDDNLKSIANMLQVDIINSITNGLPRVYEKHVLYSMIQRQLLKIFHQYTILDMKML